jgi:hypothetical protein
MKTPADAKMNTPSIRRPQAGMVGMEVAAETVKVTVIVSGCELPVTVIVPV